MKKRDAKIDRKRPISLLGIKLFVAIPYCEVDKDESLANNTSGPITVAIWEDLWGKQNIKFPKEDEVFIKSLPNADKVVKFLRGIAKATYNQYSKIARERWVKLSSEQYDNDNKEAD